MPKSGRAEKLSATRRRRQRILGSKAGGLPRSTEEDHLIVQCVRQNIFRESLTDCWQSHCLPIAITDPALLRASYVIPWSECESDADRFGLHNGLRFSAFRDAALDQGLVTFSGDGVPEFSPEPSENGRNELRLHCPIPLTAGHRSRQAQHRARMRSHSSQPSKSSELPGPGDSCLAPRKYRYNPRVPSLAR